MMEFTKPKFMPIKFLLLVFVLASFYSCHENRARSKMLECLLESLEVQGQDVDVLVGQHNGWDDSTALIIVTFYKKPLKMPIPSSDFVGHYNGKNIYFYQMNIDSADTKQYLQIPSNISWKEDIRPKRESNDIPIMFYHPMSIQIEYNIKKKKFGEVIQGKGYLRDDWQSFCLKCVQQNAN